LTNFYVLAKNELDNILYRYLQKKYPKRDNVKNGAGFYFKK